MIKRWYNIQWSNDPTPQETGWASDVEQESTSQKIRTKYIAKPNEYRGGIEIGVWCEWEEYSKYRFNDAFTTALEARMRLYPAGEDAPALNTTIHEHYDYRWKNLGE